MKRHVSAALFAATAILCAAIPASAGEVTQVGATCLASDALPPAGGVVYTTCFGDAKYSFMSDGVPTNYGLKVTAPPAHCSAVNYQVYATYDPNRMLGRARDFLSAGQSEVIPIGNDFARGLQVVNIRVLGKVGGCNAGRMQSWAALVELVVIP